MKKTKIIFLAAFICLALLAITSCSKKTPQTTKGFTDIMEEAGFEVLDITEMYSDRGPVSSVIIARNENYQIDFYKLTDNNTAIGVFSNNKQIFDDEHSSKTFSTSVSSGNYDYYAFNAEGYFHMIARVDDTMLFCEAKEEYKDEILELVKKLGYK